MLRFIVLATALVCVLGAPRVQQRPRYPVIEGSDRILGGTDVGIEELPYQISVNRRGRRICSGSIIGVDWAITVATCALRTRSNDIELRSGSAIRGQGTIHTVSQIIVHEQYDSFTNDYDVALIRVGQPFEFDATTAPIALAATAPAAGTPAFVSGWGTTSSVDILLPINLQRVEVPIYDQAACNTAYANFGGITDRMICAGLEEGGVDACLGDSGGPLTANGQLVGIVSFGHGCAEIGYPGVYSNVAVLRQWILTNTV